MIAFIMCLLLSGNLLAQNEGELFLQANQLYAQHDYAKA